MNLNGLITSLVVQMTRGVQAHLFHPNNNIFSFKPNNISKQLKPTVSFSSRDLIHKIRHISILVADVEATLKLTVPLVG